MNLLHGSTDLLEATALVEACRAVLPALRDQGVVIGLICAFRDNQGAGAALAWHKVVHRGGNLLDRAVCNFQNPSTQVFLLMGRCPTQHN